MCQKAAKARSSPGFLTWQRECLAVVHGLSYSAVEAVIVSWLHMVSITRFSQSLSLCWMFLCSWNIFPTAKCVPLALPFQPTAEGLQEKRSGFIKVDVWSNNALSTFGVAFAAALAANLFCFSCREVRLNLSQLLLQWNLKRSDQ